METSNVEALTKASEELPNKYMLATGIAIDPRTTGPRQQPIFITPHVHELYARTEKVVKQCVDEGPESFAAKLSQPSFLMEEVETIMVDEGLGSKVWEPTNQLFMQEPKLSWTVDFDMWVILWNVRCWIASRIRSQLQEQDGQTRQVKELQAQVRPQTPLRRFKTQIGPKTPHEEIQVQRCTTQAEDVNEKPREVQGSHTALGRPHISTPTPIWKHRTQGSALTPHEREIEVQHSILQDMEAEGKEAADDELEITRVKTKTTSNLPSREKKRKHSGGDATSGSPFTGKSHSAANQRKRDMKGFNDQRHGRHNSALARTESLQSRSSLPTNFRKSESISTSSSGDLDQISNHFQISPNSTPIEEDPPGTEQNNMTFICTYPASKRYTPSKIYNATRRDLALNLQTFFSLQLKYERVLKDIFPPIATLSQACNLSKRSHPQYKSWKYLGKCITAWCGMIERFGQFQEETGYEAQSPGKDWEKWTQFLTSRTPAQLLICQTKKRQLLRWGRSMGISSAAFEDEWYPDLATVINALLGKEYMPFDYTELVESLKDYNEDLRSWFRDHADTTVDQEQEDSDETVPENYYLAEGKGSGKRQTSLDLGHSHPTPMPRIPTPFTQPSEPLSRWTLPDFSMESIQSYISNENF